MRRHTRTQGKVRRPAARWIAVILVALLMPAGAGGQAHQAGQASQASQTGRPGTGRQVYRPITELATPETAGAPNLALSPQLVELTRTECAVDARDAIEAINRWTGELYPYNEKASCAYMLAMLLDPVTAQVREAFERASAGGGGTPAEKIAQINEWTLAHMSHTQFDPAFADFPANDPWGTIDTGPGGTYRKLLPSEMKAMRFHTGRISGKCMTLAHLIAGAFLQMGVAPDDLFILHMRTGPRMTHGAALFRYEGELFTINNMAVGPAPLENGTNAHPLEVIGLYNHLLQQPCHLAMAAGTTDAALLSNAPSLLDGFVENYRLDARLTEHPHALPCPLADRHALLRCVVEQSPASEVACLTKYAYQSLYVTHPEYYVAASLRTSAPYELAKALGDARGGAEAVFAWIAGHIAGGSIFPDHGHRIMTADQVLVFQQGSPKDKAVLAATMLTHLGIDSEMLLTDADAYVRTEGALYSAGQGRAVAATEGETRVRIGRYERHPGLALARREGCARAGALAQQGETAKALAVFEANVKAYPDAWQVHEDLAMAHKYLADAGVAGHLGLARASMARAQQLDPGNRRRYNQRAWWALKDGDPEDALRLCHDGLALMPEHGYLRSNLVQALIWTGRFQDARRLVESSANVVLRGKPLAQVVREDVEALRETYAADAQLVAAVDAFVAVGP